MNDSEVSHCTGFRSKEAFDDFFTYIEPFAKEMQYWKGTDITPKKTADSKEIQTDTNKSRTKAQTWIEG
ncbi:hypothetical protein HOLleu_05304 [Holothuria leucospilota]|uniref:Uncharacterized protein n=1 Tax=Holothuria leucospilota TaxID=206669 RepID=A0A9Q1CKJ2_HOLLE|nr:hypothetical protein HOLleu_05304 [Holothuria leucospilota]